MKGAKPSMPGNVIPMKGDIRKPVPKVPDGMCGRAAEVWAELAPHLVTKDRLDPLYLYQFRAYCQNVANFVDATIAMEVEGMYYEVQTRNGRQQKVTAAFKAQQEAMNQMRRDSALFGLSPVDAMRIATGGQGDLFQDLMDQLDGD